MHVLMVTASPPYPLHQGGAIRAYGILHGLHTAGHRVTLLTFLDDDSSMNFDETPLASLCERIITVPTPHRSTSQRLRDLLLTTDADIARRLHSDEMQAMLTQLVQSGEFDLVQFEGIEVASYLLDAVQAAPDVPAIYDAFNAEAALQRVIAEVDRSDAKRLPSAIYSYLQVGRIGQFERDVCTAATAVIAVSEEDGAVLRRYRNDDKTYVVPSGVFVNDYANSDESIVLKSNALVFTGKMDYRPNVDAMTWFSEHVLPRITQRIDAHLYIVGQKPHNRLDALRDNPHITITGWVPAIQPYLHAADVYVAPLRMGSGTRLKLLEAMASGCAIVATSTAAAGLLPAAYEHMVLHDDAAEMADAVYNLLHQPQKRVKLGSGAREFIHDTYDWAVLIPRLLHTYRELGIG